LARSCKCRYCTEVSSRNISQTCTEGEYRYGAIMRSKSRSDGKLVVKSDTLMWKD
jgi:hypothetical protein